MGLSWEMKASHNKPPRTVAQPTAGLLLNSLMNSCFKFLCQDVKPDSHLIGPSVVVDLKEISCQQGFELVAINNNID